MILSLNTLPSFLSPLSALMFYREKRVLSIFILGIAQGLPWVIIGSMLTLWLKESGITRANIGYAALIYTVYAVNFLWSPIVDLWAPKLPIAAGKRQRWVVSCLLGITLLCGVISTLDPASQAKLVVLTALVIALLSATQDIAIDAYRVDSFAQNEHRYISAAAGVITAGWWTGYAGLGYIPLRLSDLGWSWPQLYLLLGSLTFILAIITLFLPSPRFSQNTQHQEQQSYKTQLAQTPFQRKLRLLLLTLLVPVLIIWAVAGSPGLGDAIRTHSAYIPLLILCVLGLCIATGIQLAGLQNKLTLGGGHPTNQLTPRLDQGFAWLLTALVSPLREFFSRNTTKYALALLAFILLFKIGEAFLGRMSIVFYKEVGYSNTDIANYSKMLTWWLTVLFALVGGFVNAKLGLVKGLFISGVAMAATNLLFSLIAYVGPDIPLYIVTIILDSFAAAWSTVAFVSFISMMCNHAFSATQYALMASLSNLGRTSLSSVSGQVVDWLDGNWMLFFMLTTVMITPSLVILWKLKGKINSLEEQGKTEG